MAHLIYLKSIYLSALLKSASNVRTFEADVLCTFEADFLCTFEADFLCTFEADFSF